METRIALVKAEVKDDVMKGMRAAIIFGSIAILGLFFVLFLSLTIALALNALLDSWFWGFAIVTGIYLIALVVLFSLRNSEKVKNMFGDGSLQFLSKKPDSKDSEEKKEQERNQEIEKEAALREKQREIDLQEVEMEHHQREDRPSQPREQAEIKIEKKETS